MTGLIYIPLGPALSGAPEGLDGPLVGALVAQVAALAATTIAVRIAVVVGVQMVRRAYGRVRRRAPAVPWSHVLVGAWAPARCAFAMASALALPLTVADGSPFPARDLLILLSLGVVVATVAIQGLTLPRLLRALDVQDDGRDAHEEAQAWRLTAEAVLIRLDEVAQRNGVRPDKVDHFRGYYEDRAWRFAASDDGLATVGDELALRRALLDGERRRLRELRDTDAISDAVLRRVEQKLDAMDEYLAN